MCLSCAQVASNASPYNYKFLVSLVPWWFNFAPNLQRFERRGGSQVLPYALYGYCIGYIYYVSKGFCMYSPTARLLTVLELLQSYKQISGSEIARRLEVDGRTVRRYIVMLQDMGIPVEAERGPYGTYQLQRGYKLPPLMFTDTEAVALTLGLLAIREYHFPVDTAAVEGALAKTERVIPEKLLYQARALREAITFNISPPPVQPQNDFVSILSSAVQGRQRVFVRYVAWNGEETEREFDPYGIVYN